MHTGTDRTLLRRLAAQPVIWPLLCLLALLAYNLAFTPNFGACTVRDGRLYGPLIDILHRAAPVALVAIGMTLVIATAGIDLSVGAVMAMAGAVAALLLARPAPPPVPGVVLAGLAVALAAGLWNGLLVACLRIQPIIATLVLMVAGRGIAQLLTDGQIIVFENPAFEAIGTGSILGLPSTIWIYLGLLAVVLLLLRGTVAGLYVAATGGNETAAAMAGVPVGRAKLAAYGICGLTAGIAGLIATADIKAADANNVGLYLELDAILAVVIGGTPLAGGRYHPAGSVVGALIIRTLTTMILMRGVAVEYTLVVKAGIVILMCLVQSPRTRQAAGRISLMLGSIARRGSAPARGTGATT